MLGDELCGLHGPCPGAVVDGGERDSPEALTEKLGLWAADLGEFPILGLGCLGLAVAGQVEQPVRHGHPFNVRARAIMLLRPTPKGGALASGDG